MKRMWVLVALLSSMTVADHLAAQERTGLPLVVQLPGSSRALGLGNAYPMAAADPDAIFYNAGLLDTSRGITASAARYGSGSVLLSAAGTAEWWNGGVGFGVRALSYSADNLAAGVFGRGEAGLSEEGGVVGSEHVATAAYARRLFGFRVGIAAKVIDSRLMAEHETTAAADVGIARTIGRFTVGLAGRNLGADPDYGPSGKGQLPAEVTLGAATRTMPVGGLDVALAAAAKWMRGDTFSGGGGIEVSYWPVSGRTFTGRAGFRWVDDSDLQPLTLGGGFTGDRIAIDYAFEGVDGGDALHRLTLRLR